MGEVCWYNITMIVTAEQEDAIREMFKLRNWPCLINAVNETVSDIAQQGYTKGPPVLTKTLSAVDWNEDKKPKVLPENMAADISSIQDDLEVPEGKHAPEKDVEFSHNSNVSDGDSFNNSKISDTKNLTSEDYHKPAVNSTGMYDSEGTDSYTVNDYGNSSSNSSGEAASSKDKFKSLDIEKDDSRRTSPKSNRTCEQKKTKFQCSICDMYLASKVSLMRHCQRRHADEWFEFKCKDCTCMFKKVEELWQHRNEVKHEPPKEQPKFSEKKNLSPEELERLGHVKCNACGKILPNKRLLRRHFYSDHRQWMPDPICAVCGTEFKTRQELWKHKREMKHNDSLTLLQTYQCEECGKILTGGYHSFKLHQKFACKEESAEPQAKCDICGSMFKSHIHVQQHKQRTHVESPVVCDICGAMCKNKHALNSHKRRHDEKNKKFVCNHCGKAFLTGLLLKMHIRTHTKEKPYKCPLCNYKCAIKQNIQKHAVNVHKMQVKCSDIVIINGKDVHGSSDEMNVPCDSAVATKRELGGKKDNSSKTTEYFSHIESISSDSVEGSISNMQDSTASRSSEAESLSHDPASLTKEKEFLMKDKALLTREITTNKALLTIRSHESRKHFSNSESLPNSQGNISQFPVMAYNWTMPSLERSQRANENFSSQISSNIVSSAGSTSSTGSYVQMINSGLNPLSYSHSSVDPLQYQYQW